MNKGGKGITAAQCKAARALLDWSQDELCEAANLSRPPVARFELNQSTPREETMTAIRRTLERAGIEFLDENGGGVGVRLKRRAPKSKAKK